MLRSLSQQNYPLSTNRVLYWIYAGRLVVCLAVYGTAIVVGDLWQASGSLAIPGFRSIAIAGLGAAALVTPIAYWYSHISRRTPGRVFLLSQALLDLLLITGIVHITGGSQSAFPPLLYIAFVSGYALTLPFSYALLLAFSAGVAYLLDLVAAYPAQLSVAVLFQVAVFAIVAMVASIIGGRLRQAAQELRTIEGELKRLRLGTADVLRTLSSGVITMDESGQVAYMNPAAAELLDVDPDGWLGRDLLPELNDRAPEISRAGRETIRTKRVVRDREAQVDGAYSPSRRDQLERSTGASPPGSEGWGSEPVPGDAAGLPVSVSTALHAPPEAPPSVTVVMQDMRPARQLESLRLRTGRLEAVAELSASLAHEIRNPMASIRSAAEQLSRRAKGGDEEQLLTGLIVRESDRLNRLLGEFNNFARVDVVERTRIDLEHMIREVVHLVGQRPEAANARFEVEVHGQLEDLWGDPDLLHRILLNLVLNAVQAADGAVPVRVRVVADTLGPVFVPGSVELGHPVRIRVIDDGPGIEAEDMSRIFDPFFTKRKGGTGMGLAIAYRAVQAHGGVLLASSEPGKGATFSIIIPRRDLENRLSEIQQPEPMTSEL